MICRLKRPFGLWVLWCLITSRSQVRILSLPLNVRYSENQYLDYLPMSVSCVRVPKYRLHKGSGPAVVQIDGRRHDLGKHGTAVSWLRLVPGK